VIGDKLGCSPVLVVDLWVSFTEELSSCLVAVPGQWLVPFVVFRECLLNFLTREVAEEPKQTGEKGSGDSSVP
jgi:hypothetical protein